jgi:hypothetical protein
MTQLLLTPTQTVEAATRIATLRGLYGDLGGSLDDGPTASELWAQITEVHAELGDLMLQGITSS